MRQTITILIMGLALLSGCSSSSEISSNNEEPVSLSFYGVFDSEELYTPIIESFKDKHPNAEVTYKKFTNPGAYMNLIETEYEEGEGPDIFMLLNSQIPKHKEKIYPAPADLMTEKKFKKSFADVISPILVEEGQVLGLPIYIDTLALYYNKTHTSGASTWSQVKEEAINSKGIALGTKSNIHRSFDVIQLILLQLQAEILNSDDERIKDALTLYESFSDTWDSSKSKADSPEKELTPFAKGEISMLTGYSYTYKDIANEKERLRRQGVETIRMRDVGILKIPQIYNPELTPDAEINFASFFVPVVSNNSKKPELAWEFLLTFMNEDLMKEYNLKTHRPSALKSLLPEQSKQNTYGLFAAQVEKAKTLIMTDEHSYKTHLFKAIERLSNAEDPNIVVKELSEELQKLIADQEL